ncbi:GNAT family N-acetyltransferase [Aquimarina mytili]|uniref:GNAT family N-acetyltransferase n=1 Tax=Aquimarina mytili TaxID=874423 RepID=A0A937DCQ0_9FLAO|nr:GNAT family protein [Aquimarina mytili]MBL0685873.1 GNAT family N-acetyltransferase [Aquimarina mytili]
MNVSVREMKKDDIESIIDYFVNADSEFLKSMGADKSKLPDRVEWIKKLNQEFKKPYTDKEFYYIIWLLDDTPIGHSNINNIEFGNTATMHLHVWKNAKRKKGLGLELLKKTIPFYFKNFKLEKLICEPYSENIAPNKTLIRAGFEFIKKYETVPGWINFLQYVNSYELTKDQFERLKL